MNKSPQYNQQTEPKQFKSEVEEICIQQTKAWKMAAVASISENKWGVPCQRESL